MQKAYLVLEDGKVFEGTAFGATGNALGELVFTTSMVGYNDMLTDPAYYGQVVVNTFPLIGNYGIVMDDYKDKKPYINGYIVREKCDNPSNFNCKCSLEEYMKLHGLVGICDIDTRELTKILRDFGTMNCMITNDISDTDGIIEQIKAYKIQNPVEAVSDGVATMPAIDGDFHVALYDFGSKGNIESELANRGCKVTVCKYDTTAEDILNMNVDGVVISDGPGDPRDNTDAVDNIKKLVDANIPVFGISLGHQMLALAKGCTVFKLKYGHRGASQPVKSFVTGTVCITSQNHGYAIDSEKLPQCAKVTFANVNDGTCEGLEYNDCKAFSVQFHPVESGGPHDTNYLFDKFVDMMKEDK